MRGNATSRAPIISGRRKLKNAADMGITKRKIMVRAWVVNRLLYSAALRKAPSGPAS